MIFAEVQGKLGRGHSRAHERGEDLLTSTAFGLLRYLDLKDWLVPLAARLRPLPEGRVESGWLDPRDVASMKIQFWRRRSPHGEPDVVLRLSDAQGRLRHLLVIEVKLYSPKSSLAAPEPGEEGEEPAGIDSRDQLVRYWNYACSELEALKAEPSGAVAQEAAASLVYLTAHPDIPREALMESWRDPSGAQAPMRLAWLSWYDVWEVAHQYPASARSPLAAQDLATLLRHKGFADFIGFDRALDLETPWPGSGGRFWRGQERHRSPEMRLDPSRRQGWFQDPEARLGPPERFWRGAHRQETEPTDREG